MSDPRTNFLVGGLGMIKKSRDWLVEDGSNSHGENTRFWLTWIFPKNKGNETSPGGQCFFLQEGMHIFL